ncbi:MAG: CBS domain-containing protein [Proteobacteria bacterium]|nr:CBS domain-containing protein [Pseudomonadota bacterium]
MQRKNVMHPIPISDADIVEGMRVLPGYVDVATSDFKELFYAIYALGNRRMMQTVSAAVIMQSPALCVQESDSLCDVVSFLGNHGISGAPVVDGDGKVSGVVSEKDILRKVGLEGMTRSMQLMGCAEDFSPAELKLRRKGVLVREVMTRPAVSVFEESTLAEVLDIFKRQSINRIPVVNGANVPKGIITRNDIIETFSTIFL